MLSMASWFGDLNRPVDIYCERTSEAWDAEPLNAISNFVFFIASWAVWHLQRERPNAALRGTIGVSGLSSPWLGRQPGLPHRGDALGGVGRCICQPWSFSLRQE